MIFDVALFFGFIPFETVFHGSILDEKFTAPTAFYQWGIQAP
jgi:hypothetical protein